MRLKWVYAALAATPITLLAFSTGPPIKRTGVIDGGRDCTACHVSFAPANSDPAGSVRLTGVNSYVPGVPQILSVTIRHPQGARWGFQLTARFVSDTGTMAGSFEPADAETKVVCDDGSQVGSPGPCDAPQLSWIEHANAVRTATGQGHTYQFKWTPPADENGDVIFYFAGNAADGGSTNQGDRVYRDSLRIPLSSTASCSISKRPTLRTAVNAGPHAGAISANGMVEIYGTDFQSPSRSRTAGLGDLGTGPLKFPDQLSCVAVEIDGQRAPVTYVQQDQINVQAPTSNKTGPVSVVVIANPGRPNELRSDVATVTMQQYAPGFFTFGTSRSIAAQFAGSSRNVVDPSIVAGGAAAKPGDLVTLYGSGFGFTNPVWQAGEIVAGQAGLAAPTTVTIGGVQLTPSDILYAGLAPQSISGLYQFNVRIPASVADGDAPVVVTIGGVSSAATATIPVKR